MTQPRKAVAANKELTPGQKAWATRRANAEKAKGSNNVIKSTAKTEAAKPQKALKVETPTAAARTGTSKRGVPEY